MLGRGLAVHGVGCDHAQRSKRNIMLADKIHSVLSAWLQGCIGVQARKQVGPWAVAANAALPRRTLQAEQLLFFGRPQLATPGLPAPKCMVPVTLFPKPVHSFVFLQLVA